MKAILLTLIATIATISAYGQNNKTLIAYYSRTGNTETIAKEIQTLTKGDLFRIETDKTYPTEYKETTDVAKEEKNTNARPTLKTKVDDIDQYDIIFVGFPIWWGQHPMAIATFLESYNLKGKTVIPFCTHGGGGSGEAFSSVDKLTPNSTHKEGFSISGSQAKNSQTRVEGWLKGIQVIK